MSPEITLTTIPVELQIAITELLPRKDALRLALTCWSLRNIALSIVHREITISITSSALNYRLHLLRNPNVQKKVRTLKLQFDTPGSQCHASVELLLWIFTALEFPILQNFRIATSFIHSVAWQGLFMFLYRHRTLQAVVFDFHRCPEYQNYNHIQDHMNVWSHITPDFLPSVRSLTADATFLSTLARAKVQSLGQLKALHIVDYCIRNQDAVWGTISGAADLFQNLPVLIFTCLPTEDTPPPFEEIYGHLALAFTGVKHLSTNFGEGQWTPESLEYLLYMLPSLYTLSIPVRVAQDFLTDLHADETEGEQLTPTTELALPAPPVIPPAVCTLANDLIFRRTPDIQKVTAEITKQLQEMSPVQSVILHMPGWYPTLFPF